MVTSFQLYKYVAGILAIPLVGLLAPLAATALDDTPAGTTAADRAADLVRQALAAEAAGQPTERAALLREALQVDPDNPAAHWQSGQIRAGKQWLPLSAATEAEERAGKIAKYRQMRDKAGDTYPDQLKLAHFCEAGGLSPQARVHLTNVLRLQPNSPEAVRRLGLVRFQGKYLTAAQLDQLKAAAKSKEALARKWGPQFKKLRAQLESDDAVQREAAHDELLAICDPAAIPAFESLTLASSPAVGETVVAHLAHMAEQAATDSLVRHAVFAADSGVRQQAAEALRPRSIYSYVPTFMSYLELPVDVQFQTYLLDDGRPAHQLTMFQEGLFGSNSFTSEGAATGTIEYSRRNARVDGIRVADKSLRSDLALARNAQAANVVREERNQRVADALQTTVEEKFGPAPKDWWDWWAMKNELYISPEKPVTYTTRSNPSPPVTIHYHSCFVAGTGVWTMTGPMAIEKIHAGECVLSQNIDSGELAFKPVVATTVRPASPLVEIRVGETMIRATRGHPFWVSGTGWQMAKELKAGQYLHTASGPALIDEIGAADPEECYNLVVADNGNYFVSDAQVQVHDNNIRDVTAATVPGYVPDGQ